MPEIHVLPNLLVNKIAAGEVIERPASVVKELVENSLDAGARRIEIAVEQGGRKLIRIVDDGAGMDRNDVSLCVQPHATSKIHREEDLTSIRTMGFRGEALASVGAVSQLRVVSRRASSDEAHEARVIGDRIEPVAAAAGPVGTTVEVRELFCNVPARQKFLRTAQTELGHITEQLARIALVHPEVEFRLTHNARLVHHLRPAQGMRSRIADFYGRDMADALLEVSREERGLKIIGLTAPPADSRSSGKWQYLFLNGRYIRDRFVTHATREAYRGLIESHRYPVIFLTLQIDPGAVDVNVHPTKIEVRWRDSNAVYSQVLSALRDRFLNADLTPALQADRGGPSSDTQSHEESDATAAGVEQAASNATPNRSRALAVAGPTGSTRDDDPAEVRRRQIRESIADFFKRSRPTTGASPGQTGGTSASAAPRPATIPAFPPATEPPQAAPSIRTPQSAVGNGQGESLESAPPAPEERRDAGPQTQPCDNAIQIHRSYLVAGTADGLVIVDQHALHERILYEQLAEQLSRGPLESQRLLIPETIDVSPDQVAVIETHADVLEQLGFELSAYGPNSIAMHAAPTLLKPERMMAFLRDMLDRLAVRSGPASTELLTDDLVSMMACKAAVKAGDPLAPEEIQALMSQRHRVERSSSCPHGRPTSLRLTLHDLERQFKRT